MSNNSQRSPLLPRGSWAETKRIAEILRRETVGGVLLLIASVIAVVWANSAWRDDYD
ncbi:Na+/H+ antiporter NhaA, partial [Aeromicrobium sp.]|uniref:Na+/H+ antiporter NhaA n=1 Tax=Aeromicrobium sp. TaxID=1871063 RepID=UPI003C3FABF1